MDEHHYEVKVLDSSEDERTVVDIYEADSITELEETIREAAEDEQADYPRHIEIHRVVELP